MNPDSETIQLPEGWRITTLGNVLIRLANGISRKQIKKHTKFPVTRIETISDGFIDTTRLGYLTEMSSDECKKYELISGDILFSNINSLPHLGKTAIVSPEIGKLYHGMNLLLLRPNHQLMIPDFLHFLCMNYRNSGKFAPIAKHAVNQASINQTNLAKLKIPLPPLQEQKIIVSRISGAVQRTRSTKQELSRIPALTRRLRMAILSKAFRGELTNRIQTESAKLLYEKIQESRRRVKSKKQNNATKQNNLPALPPEWMWTTIGNLVMESRYGTSRKCTSDEKGTPILRIPNVVNGFNPDDLKFTSLSENELKSLKIRNDDILVVRTNGSLGLVGSSLVIKNVTKDFGFASYLIRLRFPPIPYLAEYIALLMKSDLGRNAIESKARTTAGQYNVNTETLYRIPIPLPTEKELKEIVEICNITLMKCAQLESNTYTSKGQLDLLESSILSQAFEGRLTIPI